MDIQMRGNEEIEDILKKICHLERQIFILERVNRERAKITARLRDVMSSGYYGIRFQSGKKGRKTVSHLGSVGAALWAVISAGLFFWGILKDDSSLFWIAMISACLLTGMVCIMVKLKKRNLEKRKTYQMAIDRSAEKELSDRIKTADQEIRLLHSERDMLYKENNIPIEYRSLAAVSLFLDYIASGRCSMLFGEGGAYHRLEEEMEQKQVILCDIYDTGKLKKIKENQYMLYQAVQESDKMLDELCGITKKTIVNADVFHCRE